MGRDLKFRVDTFRRLCEDVINRKQFQPECTLAEWRMLWHRIECDLGIVGSC